jgi:nicotinamidase-related amidase
MKDTAVLVIDLQKGMLYGENKTFKVDTLIKNVKGILETARKNNYHVYMVQHAGPKGDELEPATEGWMISDDLLSTTSETVIHKSFPDAFQETDLDMVLKSDGIKNLIIVGMQSELCIDTTCKSAFSHGYKVVLASDAHSTYKREDIEPEVTIKLVNSVISDWFGEVISTEKIINSLKKSTI